MKATYIEKNDTGATLSTWLYCNMWQLYAAEQAGLTPCYIHWPQGHNTSLIPLQDPAKFAELPNMYDWYFIQPHEECRSGVPECERRYVWEHDAMGQNGESITGKYCLQGQGMEYLRYFYGKNLHFNDASNARGESLKQKYGLDFSKTIGVTWRGTDSITDGRLRIEIEEYFPHIDEILGAGPSDMRILATAEEQGVTDAIVARYGDRVIVPTEFYSSPPLPKNCTLADYHASSHAAQHNPEWTSPMTGFERGMQVVSIIWLMSKCAHYIKNRSSMAYVSSWLSSGNVISIRHPEVA